MDPELLTCTICFESYDQGENLPRILPACGHTICSACLKSLILHPNAKCPLDSIMLSSNVIASYPVNFLVKKVIVSYEDKGICKEHQEYMDFMCFTDMRRICSECMWKDNHQTHKIKSLKAIKIDAEDKRRKLEALLDEMDINLAKEISELEQERNEYLRSIEDSFQSYRDLLYLKEIELNSETAIYFNQRLAKLNTTIGVDSHFRNHLCKKIKGLADILKNEEHLMNIDLSEDIEDYLNQCRPKIELSKELKSIKGSSCKSLEAFCSFLESQTQLWSKLKVPLGDCSQNSSGNQIKLNTYLDFKCRDNSIEILTENSVSSEVVLDLEDLIKADKIIIGFKEKISHIEDLQLLQYIWKNTSQASSLILKLNPFSISEDMFLLLTVDSKTFSDVKIHLEGHSLLWSQSKEAELVGKLLAKNDKLGKISLSLNKTWISTGSFQVDFQKQVVESKFLTDFTLNLPKINLTEHNICEIFPLMSNVKKLQLKFLDSNITDQTFFLFIEKRLKQMNSLEDLHLSLCSTNITDLGLRCLNFKYNKLRSFILDLGDTLITDNTLNSLAIALRTSFADLEIFGLGLKNTQVTDKGVCRIFTNMPKVRSFTLGLNNVKAISDVVIEKFAQNTLGSLKSLETLALCLQSTQITDTGMKTLCAFINNVKSLTLALASTQVTNSSIGLLIRDTAPKMTNLASLNIDLSDTSVDKELKAEIYDFTRMLQSK